MPDSLKSAAPTASSLTFDQFLARWDNNAGAKTVDAIDNLVITFDEIRQGGSVVAFAKDFEAVAAVDRKRLTLEVSPSQRAQIDQAVRNVRQRYFGSNTTQAPSGPAQRFQLTSWTARKHIQQAKQHLEGLGFSKADLRSTQVVRDPLGITHVRFERLVNNYALHGEQIVAHIKSGAISVSGTTLPTPTLGGAAKAGNLQRVLAEAVQRFGSEPVEFKVEKAAIRQGATAVLGWIIELSNFARRDGGPRSMTFLVDGQNSKLIDAFRSAASEKFDTKPEHGEFIAAFTSSGGVVPPRASFRVAPQSAEEALQLTPKIQGLVQALVAEEGRKQGTRLSATFAQNEKGAWALKPFSSKLPPVRPSPAVQPPPFAPEKPVTSTDSADIAKPEDKSKFIRLPLDHLSAAQGDDYVPFSARVNLATIPERAGYALHATSWEHDGIETRDADKRWSAEAAATVEDDDDAWNTQDTQAQQSGAAAQYGAMMTYEFLREMGFNSIDLRGERLVSNVNMGTDFVNAYWNGRAMHYGEGDGKASGPLTTLDIAGHEIMHGFTERTAGLIYWQESGGLNESFSDIAGFMVEYLASKRNSSVSPDWSLGEDTWTPTNGNHRDALRYMDDPETDGYSVGHYSKYPEQTEVHGSSGIQNNAFYQLAYPDNRTKKSNRVSGVAVPDGIGVEKAARIFFHALAYYLTPNSTFADARAASIESAGDLHGPSSIEAKKTAEAWSAVGVEAPQ